MTSGKQSIPLSVPIAISAPAASAASTGGDLPKYPLDVGQRTTGTSASAHMEMSDSSAMHMWTTKAGSRDRANPTSSLVPSLTWMPRIFPLERTSSARASM